VIQIQSVVIKFANELSRYKPFDLLFYVYIMHFFNFALIIGAKHSRRDKRTV